jgi:hypothetical protein
MHMPARPAVLLAGATLVLCALLGVYLLTAEGGSDAPGAAEAPSRRAAPTYAPPPMLDPSERPSARVEAEATAEAPVEAPSEPAPSADPVPLPPQGAAVVAGLRPDPGAGRSAGWRLGQTRARIELIETRITRLQEAVANIEALGDEAPEGMAEAQRRVLERFERRLASLQEHATELSAEAAADGSAAEEAEGYEATQRPDPGTVTVTRPDPTPQ